MRYLIANWKAHKSLSDVEQWLSIFTEQLKQKKDIMAKLDSKEIAIIIAPSFPHLQTVKAAIESLPNCFVGALSVSKEQGGNFTGEVTAAALKNIVSYAVVGHSERRSMGESVEDINAQLDNLYEHSIEPVLCVRTGDEFPKNYSGLVAYEPPGAIASSNNAPLDEVMKVYNELHLDEKSAYLYGGSVDEESSKEYLSREEIKGFLVGTASLHPESFLAIAELL